jgi:radical SAM protein with 4Fe4S-binding SPASM domain
MNVRGYIRDMVNFFRTLSLRKILNLFLVEAGYLFSLLIRKPVVWGMPHTLSVEPVTRCNLSCPECPVGNHTLNRPSGEMAPELFRKILDPAAPKLMHLILYFQGEPFLSPHLFELIGYAKQRSLYVSTSTNGHYLDEKNIRKLLTSGLDRLIISLDGASQESYEKYRVGGDFQKVKKGIQELVQRKEKGHFRKPLIIIQFLMFRHNLHEREQMKYLARELGVDRLEFKTAQFYDLSEDNQLIPEDPVFSRYRKEGQKYVLKYVLKNRCPRLWNTAVITWDGKMVPCCFDKNAECLLGDLNKRTLQEVWFSGSFTRFRTRVLRARKEIPMCRNCTEGLSGLR